MTITERLENATEYRLIEAANPQSTNQPHTLVVKLDRSTHRVHQDGAWALQEAKLNIVARCVSGPYVERRPIYVASMGGHFRCGWTDMPANIKLTGGGVWVQHEYRGLHIGTYLMNLVVDWALNLEVDAVVEQISLIEGDARSCAVRDRRNRLYTRFGIRFDYESGTAIERTAGRSAPDLRLAELHSSDEVEGIIELRLEESLSKLALEACAAKRDAAEQRRALECTRAWYREEADARSARRRLLSRTLLGCVTIAAISLLIVYTWAG